MAGLSIEQVDKLCQPIFTGRVMQTRGQSNLPQWDVRAHLNRIFGFGGWDKQVLSIELVDQHRGSDEGVEKGKTGWYVTYRCLMRLIIRDDEGNVVALKEDGACGSASNQPDLGGAHDFAYKNAISYALKRCAIDLGDQFGLSLYNKGMTAALVGRTLVGGSNTTGDVDAHAPEPHSMGDDEPDDPAPSPATTAPPLSAADEEAQKTGWKDDAQRKKAHDGILPGIKKLIETDGLPRETCNKLYKEMVHSFLPLSLVDFNLFMDAVEHEKQVYADSKGDKEKAADYGPVEGAEQQAKAS